MVLRWIARAWSLASLAFVALFLLGNRDVPSPGEVLGLALFPGGVAAGLVIAWRHERLGGAIAIGSLAAFHAGSLLVGSGIPRGPWFLLIAAPGLLFLVTPESGRRERPAG